MKARTIFPDSSMEFELTMRLFFGDKAYHIADQGGTPKYRRQWIKRALRLVMKRVDNIETTQRHKQVLMAAIEATETAVGVNDQPSWYLVYGLLALIGRLLGFDYGKGGQLHNLSYWQTSQQYYTGEIFAGKSVMQDYDDRKDVISIRQRIVELLKKHGLSDFKAALVLNTTEYEVQKLRRTRNG